VCSSDLLQQPGSSNGLIFEDTKKPFDNPSGTRLLFYRGIKTDSTGTNSVPLGTPDVYDYFKNKIPEANLSLRWEGEYGLYEKLWKPVIEDFILKTRQVEIQRIISPIQLRQLDFSEKYRARGIDYIYDEITIPVSETTIGPASIVAYKV